MKHSVILAIFLLAVVILSTGIYLFILSNNEKETENDDQVLAYSYEVINVFPHDAGAFTEGLVYVDGFLYESTGLYQESSLRRVEMSTGKTLREILLGNSYFGEGIAAVGNKIIQLTWQEHVAFVYDRDSFTLLGNFTYPTEGWGLTFDGSKLIMSDGTDQLYFLDPTTYQPTSQVQVRDGNNSVFNLNELEYVNGEVYANVFLEQKIAIINPQTGQVKAWIYLSGIQDLTGLGPEMVLNGIAYDKQNNRLFVTGKNWPSLYEITLNPLK